MLLEKEDYKTYKKELSQLNLNIEISDWGSQVNVQETHRGIDELSNFSQNPKIGTYRKKKNRKVLPLNPLEKTQELN